MSPVTVPASHKTLEFPVRLRCKRCQALGSYHVGAVHVSRDNPTLEGLRFSAPVHCHRCMATGSWSYPSDTSIVLTTVMLRLLSES